MNSILEEDIKNIADSKLVNWEEFNNKSILITGATGLICSIMIKAFCKKKLNLKMYLLVRNKENAKQMYGENENIEYIESSIENFNVEDIKVDYIIHAASPTKSKFFVEKPVETLNTAVLGTKNILEFAKNIGIKSMVYLSSMEMYGTMNDENVTEIYFRRSVCRRQSGYKSPGNADGCVPVGSTSIAAAESACQCGAECRGNAD